MRKAILHLILSLALMPSLLCAMPLCDLGEAVDQNKKVHCADQQKSDQSSPSTASTVMLIADCSQIDLAITPYPNLETHLLELDLDSWEYDQSDTQSFHFLKKPPIRGSPKTAQHSNYPPIYLATQRLRI